MFLISLAAELKKSFSLSSLLTNYVATAGFKPRTLVEEQLAVMCILPGASRVRVRSSWDGERAARYLPSGADS